MQLAQIDALRIFLHVKNEQVNRDQNPSKYQGQNPVSQRCRIANAIIQTEAYTEWKQEWKVTHRDMISHNLS